MKLIYNIIANLFRTKTAKKIAQDYRAAQAKAKATANKRLDARIKTCNSQSEFYDRLAESIATSQIAVQGEALRAASFKEEIK